MAGKKTLQKKSLKRHTRVLKKTQNRLGRFFKQLAGKELAIWISIWFVLMSLLMLFANSLRVDPTGDTWSQIHAAASVEEEWSETQAYAGIDTEVMPWIWQ